MAAVVGVAVPSGVDVPPLAGVAAGVGITVTPIAGMVAALPPPVRLEFGPAGPIRFAGVVQNWVISVLVVPEYRSGTFPLLNLGA